jgi:hypothetical protein
LICVSPGGRGARLRPPVVEVATTTAPLVVRPEDERVLMQEEGSIRRSHTCNESRTTCISEQKLYEGGAFFGNADFVLDPDLIRFVDYNLNTKIEGRNSLPKRKKEENFMF